MDPVGSKCGFVGRIREARTSLAASVPVVGLLSEETQTAPWPLAAPKFPNMSCPPTFGGSRLGGIGGFGSYCAWTKMRCHYFETMVEAFLCGVVFTGGGHHRVSLQCEMDLATVHSIIKSSD